MRNLHILAASLVLGLSGISPPWDEGFATEKSDLPKKEPMPLTDEETEKLNRLHGKYKKLYLKELKEKYGH